MSQIYQTAQNNQGNDSENAFWCFERIFLLFFEEYINSPWEAVTEEGDVPPTSVAPRRKLPPELDLLANNYSWYFQQMGKDSAASRLADGKKKHWHDRATHNK